MSLTLHTSLGDVKIELHCDLVPKMTFNMLALAAAGKYNNTKFHRNLAGFMIQGGDTSGTGKGGESIWGGHIPDEFSPHLKHKERGVVSMANRGANTNGSQFFFTYAPQAHLDNVYSIVGKVIHGFDTLDAMERTPVTGKKSRPVTDIVIERVTIHANPFADTPVDQFQS
jgi:peptidyl-prolyl cis-trans isomerase-like 3|eukprot:Stramenopile-MAST_4_protein_3506